LPSWFQSAATGRAREPDLRKGSICSILGVLAVVGEGDVAALLADEQRGAGGEPAEGAGLDHLQLHLEREGDGLRFAVFEEEDLVEEVGENEVELAVVVPVDGVGCGGAVLVDGELDGGEEAGGLVGAFVAPEVDVAVEGAAGPLAFFVEGVVPAVIAPLDANI
jgi:hypothetical protein